MKLDPGVMQLILYKFAHAQTLSRMSSLSGRMNIGRVNWMEENQTALSHAARQTSELQPIHN
jgi:hypothetical protein